MNRNKALADRLQEVLLDGKWIANTNYKAQLTGVNWLQATQKINELNSIAALTYHINYYLSGLISAFENGRLDIHDKFSFNLPPIQSQLQWEHLVTDFLNNAEQFITLVRNIDDATFDQPFIDEKYGTVLRNIEGVIEHCYYHLGQVVLVNKLTHHTQ